jgi:hypothetical protein
MPLLREIGRRRNTRIVLEFLSGLVGSDPLIELREQAQPSDGSLNRINRAARPPIG